MKHVNFRPVNTSLLFVIFGVVLSSLQTSQGAEPPVKLRVQLGVTLAKPSAEVYAQLPALARGCGFVLKSVEPDSSAAKVGLKPLDVIWKIDDQLLINEGQLAVLLSLRKLGDEVKLDYFQSGEAKRVSMKLSEVNTVADVTKNQAAAFPFPLDPDLPIHVVSYEDKSATISNENGTATLKFNDGKPWLVISDNKGVENFNAAVDTSSEVSMVPASWRAKLPMLQRSLKSSASLRRLPRVRRVPNPTPQLVDGAK